MNRRIWGKPLSGRLPSRTGPLTMTCLIVLPETQLARKWQSAGAVIAASVFVTSRRGLAIVTFACCRLQLTVTISVMAADSKISLHRRHKSYVLGKVDCRQLCDVIVLVWSPNAAVII